MSSDLNKKYKRVKKKPPPTTHPETSTSRNSRGHFENDPAEHVCPLLAKDSEWVDILHTSEPGAARSSHDGDASDEEDGPQMKPLAIMFPGLLDKDPETLHGMLNRAMSTTEVTRHLVDLGQKANFSFMKKSDRLIPPDKERLESVKENSNSVSSLSSILRSECFSSNYEASDEKSMSDTKLPKKKRNALSKNTTLFLKNDDNGATDQDQKQV